MSRIVIAMGGNALGTTAEEQLTLVTKAAKPIVDLVENGNEVLMVHGNGPQIGMTNLGMTVAAETGVIKANVPLPECGAMSQGYIGYHLQSCIQNELAARGIQKSAVSVVTQVLVEETDPAFSNPTKPIGGFYTREQAEQLHLKKGYIMKEDAGRGYRRVVASPEPIDVVEKDAIKTLVDAGQVVIAVGGGGIPVVKRNGKLTGIPAVIDKDFSAAKIAELIGADLLIILTSVERVAINFGKPDEILLEKMNLEEAFRYIEEGQFAPGSMLPKVMAAVNFAKAGGTVIIASLERAEEAIKGNSGTTITG